MVSGYFKLVRPVNLGIIVLTQLLLRFCVVEVYLGLSGVRPALGYVELGLIVLATLLIAAGGYVINDLYDQQTDKVNKPAKVIIGPIVSRKAAWRYYWSLTIPGVVIGILLAGRIDFLVLGLIFPAVAGLLFLYSAQYQKTVLTGNLVVALTSAMVIAVLWLFEFFALKADAIRFVDALRQIPVLQIIVAGYSLFAFLVSLLREIVKDAEDVKGDKESGYRTLPAVYGVRAARNLTIAIHLLTMAVLGAAMVLLYREGLMLVFWYLAAAVMLLLGYVLHHLSQARISADFSFLSNAYKLIMLAGILSMEIFYISF